MHAAQERDVGGSAALRTMLCLRRRPISISGYICISCVENRFFSQQLHESYCGMKLSQKFEEALVYANRAHCDQERKKTGVPYVAHILGVSAITLEYGGTETE